MTGDRLQRLRRADTDVFRTDSDVFQASNAFGLQNCLFWRFAAQNCNVKAIGLRQRVMCIRDVCVRLVNWLDDRYCIARWSSELHC